MKIELDFDNPKQLRLQEAMLLRALNTVRHAISEHQSRAVDLLSPPTNGDGSAHEIVNKREFVEQVIDQMPMEFNSSQLFESVKTNRPNVSKGTVKMGVKKAIQSGRIKVKAPGSGPKPCIYVRIQK